MAARTVLVYGVDFTSAPRRAKPIVVATGVNRAGELRITNLEQLEDFTAFERMLERSGPWIGGFDFPFGMPVQLLRDLRWPQRWPALVRHCKAMSRDALRATLDAYRSTRPVGGKYVHRATDGPAGSSSPMKLVNPPVALMFHEGAPRLLQSGVHVPGLVNGDVRRVALEAYPGLLARSVTRASYKNDARTSQTRARSAARTVILDALQSGEHALGLKVSFAEPGLRRRALEDGSGDALDATLCAVQAGWAARQRNYGLPAKFPGCEGWIVGAQPNLRAAR